MIANHIHDALSQVRQLQGIILDKHSFKGFSGRTRILGGFGAMIGAMAMSQPVMSPSPWAHLIGWGCVLLAALTLNYFGLLYWFAKEPSVKGQWKRLLPALEAWPALGLGAFLSIAMVIHGQFQFLFGIWMSLYGLVHVCYRNTLPRSNYLVGIFYMVCGAICLLTPLGTFTFPWTMGLVFFVGEIAGGIIFYRHRFPLGERTES